MVFEKMKKLLEETRSSDEYKNEKFQLEIVASFLRKMREKDITQAELARRTGLHNSYLSRVLSSSSNLTLATMRKIAEALDVKLEMKLVERFETPIDIEASSRLINAVKPEPIIARIFLLPSDTSWNFNGEKNESLACSA